VVEYLNRKGRKKSESDFHVLYFLSASTDVFQALKLKIVRVIKALVV